MKLQGWGAAIVLVAGAMGGCGSDTSTAGVQADRGGGVEGPAGAKYYRRALVPVQGEERVLVVDSVDDAEGSSVVITTIAGDGTASQDRIEAPSGLVDLSGWWTGDAVIVAAVACSADELAAIEKSDMDPQEAGMCMGEHNLYRISTKTQSIVDEGPLPDGIGVTRVTDADAQGRAVVVPEVGNILLVQRDGTRTAVVEGSMESSPENVGRRRDAAFCEVGGRSLLVVALSRVDAEVGFTAEGDSATGSTSFELFDPATGERQATVAVDIPVSTLACAGARAFSAGYSEISELQISMTSVEATDTATGFLANSVGGAPIVVSPTEGERTSDTDVRSLIEDRLWIWESGGDAPRALVATGRLLVVEVGVAGQATALQVEVAS